jgi:hypothetical protein
VSISRRARASTSRILRLHELPRMLVPGFTPAASRPFGSRSRQRITFPRDPSDALSDRRHSVGDLGELGRFLSRGVQLVGWISGRAWERAGSDPGPSTDVCSSRILFSKTIAPSLGARRIICVPTSMRELAVARRNAHFGEPIGRASKHCPLRSRPNGVPLMPRRRGRPRRSCVHRRRPAIANAISGRKPEA